MHRSFYLAAPVLLSLLLYLCIAPSAQSSTANLKAGAKTSVNAVIPASYSIKLFGYTSPQAIVEVFGIRVFALGYSDRSGYFEFKDIAISNEAKEVCISSIDNGKRVSFPVCIPLTASIGGEVGPVLLPPSLALTSSLIYQNDKAFAVGTTIPETEVEIALFESDKETGKTAFNRLGIPNIKAYAQNSSKLKTTASQDGSFKIQIPSNESKQLRLYAKATFQKNPTPKSQTLSVEILSAFLFFIRSILPILTLILIILALLGILLYVINKKKKEIKKLLEAIIEKRWKPIEVRLRLLVVRVQNIFQREMRKHQK